MAKRFTDTDKWKDPWFNGLDIKAKLTWIYICDSCDHAGIWLGDFKLLSFHVGCRVTEKQFIEWFGSRVIKFNNQFFIKSFFNFQYANSKEGFRAKQSAIAQLKKYGLSDQIYDYLECPPTLDGVSPDTPSISIGKSIGIGTSTSNTGECEGVIDFQAGEEKEKLLTPREVMEVWNDVVGDKLPRANELTDKRAIKLRKLIKKHPNLSVWRGWFEKLLNMPWMLGENESKWKASFDFVLQDKSFTKLTEGAYDNLVKQAQSPWRS